MRIYIAGGDPVLVEKVSQQLRQEGHRVFQGLSDKGLLEVILAEEIDLVILEVGVFPFDQCIELCHSISRESELTLLLLVGDLSSPTEKREHLRREQMIIWLSPSAIMSSLPKYAHYFVVIPSIRSTRV